MNKNAPEVLQIPNEVYDSDGDGNENWQDDIDYIDFEEDKNEGKVHYIRGKIEEEGPCGQVLKAPRSEYTRYLMSSVPKIGKPLT